MQPTSPRPHLLEQGKGWKHRKSFVGSCTSLHEHSLRPQTHLPALYTPAHTLPSLPGKPAWEMGRDVQRYRKRTVVPQRRADFLPWRRRTSLPGNQGVARPALHPLKAGTQSSSPHQPRQTRQDGTSSQTDLERNIRVLYPPHTAATFPTECGLVHTQILKVQQETCFSLSEPLKGTSTFPQEACHLIGGVGGGGPYICLQCDPVKPGGCPHVLYRPQAGLQ